MQFYYSFQAWESKNTSHTQCSTFLLKKKKCFDTLQNPQSVCKLKFNSGLMLNLVWFVFFSKEGPINFKALRAKFQEDVLLAQYISKRPAVAEKPKYVPPPVVSGMTIAAENNSPVLSRVIYRDGLRASGGTRPNSFPPHLQQTSPSSQFANGDSTAKQSLKERHMPLVLPAFPVKEQKTDSPVAQLLHAQDPDSVKVAFSQNKIKKKGLLLPFKSTKASKVSAGNGEEPTYADLTTRPSSAPGELPSIKMQPTENGGSVQSDNSNVTECSQSSPDAPITPPSSETSVDSDNKFISTLERAKKKFSRRQMLISTKPKSFRSPDYAQAVNVFPFATNTESVSTDPPLMPPFGLPHMACISARPFFKAGNSLRSKFNSYFDYKHIFTEKLKAKKYIKKLINHISLLKTPHMMYCIYAKKKNVFFFLLPVNVFIKNI